MDKNSRQSLSRRSVLKGAGAAGLVGAAGITGARSAFATPALHLSTTRPGRQVSGKVTLAYLGTADQSKIWDNLFALFKEKYPDIELVAEPNPVNNWAAFFDGILDADRRWQGSGRHPGGDRRAAALRQPRPLLT